MRCLLLAALMLAALPRAAAQTPAALNTPGVVVCVSPIAADVGAKVLADGGNAVDAAVATGFALAVTWPEAGNIGGGGFMLVHPGGGKAARFFDYREVAPRAATPTMFAAGIDSTSPKVAGVPGSVRGLELAHKTLGKLPWKALVAPAAELAARGFRVNKALALSLNKVLADPKTTNAEFRKVYGKPGGAAWAAGDTLTLPDLGRTLAAIAEEGAAGFYAGPVAEKLAQEMTRAGGLITARDLAEYQAKERDPVVGTYRGYEVVSAPPPSSGGLTLVQMLNMLEPVDVKAFPRQSPETVHRLAEVMRRAYRERAAHLGDPDFVTIPDTFAAKTFAAKLAASIRPERATPSEQLLGDIRLTEPKRESDETTHYSVLDKAGMAVSTTTTLENAFGCRVVVPGVGFLLNNEMTDFNHAPGVTDRTGRIGTPANVAAPGKRMLSSMCPTILAKAGRPVLVTGSPGGRTIINTVLCVVVNAVDYNMTARAAVVEPRQHHAWFPDRLTLEDRPGADALVAELRRRGHVVVKGAKQGDAHTIRVDPATGAVTAAADARLDGAVAEGAKK